MVMYIFLMVFAVISYNLIRKKNRNKKYCIMMAIVLILVAGLRKYTVGADTEQFCNVYKSINSNDWSYYHVISGFGGRMEPGFYLLCKLLGYITKDFQILIFVSSAFTIGVFYWFIYKESIDPCLSTILFIGFTLFAFNLTGMRQSIAIAIIILGYEFALKQKKDLLFAFYIMVALLFHDSAFLCFGLWILSKFKTNFSNVFTILLVGVLVFIFSDYLLNIMAKALGYNDYNGSMFDVTNYFGSIIKNAIYFIVFFIIYKSNKMSKDRKMMLYFSLSAFVLGIISMKMVIIDRATIYFYWMPILVLPNYIYNLNKEYVKLTKSFVILLSFSYLIVVLGLRPEWYRVTPYLFYWQ